LAFESVHRFVGVSVARLSRSGGGDCEDIAAVGADWVEELVLCLIKVGNLKNRKHTEQHLGSQCQIPGYGEFMKYAELKLNFLLLTQMVQKYIPHR
jgi:hypothetical protein